MQEAGVTTPTNYRVYVFPVHREEGSGILSPTFTVQAGNMHHNHYQSLTECDNSAFTEESTQTAE